MANLNFYVGFYIKVIQQSEEQLSNVAGWSATIFERLRDWVKKFFQVLIFQRLVLGVS